MRLGLDVDGVLYQWSGCVRKILAREYGIILEESKSWNYIQENTPEAVWKELWVKHIEEMYTGGEFYPMVKSILGALRQDGHDVYLITATPEAVRPFRLQHLAHHFPLVCGINFVPIRSHDKTMIQCDVYLDDKPEIAVESSLKAKSFLQDRPWNQGFTHPDVTRVADLSDFRRSLNG